MLLSFSTNVLIKCMLLRNNERSCTSLFRFLFRRLVKYLQLKSIKIVSNLHLNQLNRMIHQTISHLPKVNIITTHQSKLTINLPNMLIHQMKMAILPIDNDHYHHLLHHPQILQNQMIIKHRIFPMKSYTMMKMMMIYLNIQTRQLIKYHHEPFMQLLKHYLISFYIINVISI